MPVDYIELAEQIPAAGSDNRTFIAACYFAAYRNPSWYWGTGSKNEKEEEARNLVLGALGHAGVIESAKPLKFPFIPSAEFPFDESHKLKKSGSPLSAEDTTKAYQDEAARIKKELNDKLIENLNAYAAEAAPAAETPAAAETATTTDSKAAARRAFIQNLRYWLAANPTAKLSDLKTKLDPAAKTLLDNDEVKKAYDYTHAALKTLDTAGKALSDDHPAKFSDHAPITTTHILKSPDGKTTTHKLEIRQANVMKRCNSEAVSTAGHGNNPLGVDESLEAYQERIKKQLDVLVADNPAAICLQECDFIEKGEGRVAKFKVSFDLPTDYRIVFVGSGTKQQAILYNKNKLEPDISSADVALPDQIGRHTLLEQKFTVLDGKGAKVDGVPPVVIASAHLDYTVDYTTALPAQAKKTADAGAYYFCHGDFNHAPGDKIAGVHCPSGTTFDSEKNTKAFDGFLCAAPKDGSVESKVETTFSFKVEEEAVSLAGGKELTYTTEAGQVSANKMDKASTFTKEVSKLVRSKLDDEKFAQYQKLSYEQQYLFFCHLVGHDCGQTPHKIADSTKALADALGGDGKAQLEGLFKAYKPNMVNVGDLDKAIADMPSTTSADTKKGGVGFYLLGPGVDAYASAGFPAFKGAIIQAASQFNNLEFPSNKSAVDPIGLRDDHTQGPAVQEGCPALALARYKYWQEHGNEESFLTEWKKQPNFSDIFAIENGYMWPRAGKEEAAVQFISEHKDKLRINVEFTEYTKAQHEITQVLNAAMALAFKYSEVKYTDKKAIKEATTELLKIQYEMVAKLAVLEAKRNPGQRIPLVLTALGGGVFENDSEAIKTAMRVAIEVVKNSGVPNIDVAISAYEPEDVEKYTSVFSEVGEVGEYTQLQTKDLQGADATLFQIAQQKKEPGAKGGCVHPLRVDWKDEKGAEVSAKDQAKKILDAALQLQKQGAKQVGITYSANSEEAAALHKNSKYNQFGANQGAVMAEVQRLLDKDAAYSALKGHFKIIPFATMQKSDSKAAASEETKNACIKYAKEFVHEEGGVLLAWQNQKSNDKNPGKKYAIGGGIAKDPTKKQKEALVEYLNCVDELRTEYPSPYKLDATTASEPGDNTTSDQKKEAFAEASKAIPEQLKASWKDDVVDVKIKDSQENKTTYEIKFANPADASKPKIVNATISQTIKSDGGIEFRCDAKSAELSLEKQYELIARQSFAARTERAKHDPEINPSRVVITDIGGPGKGGVSGFKDAKNQEVLLTDKEKMVLAAYFKADPKAEIVYKGHTFSDSKQFAAEAGKVAEKKPGWRNKADDLRGGPAAAGTESTADADASRAVYRP